MPTDALTAPMIGRPYALDRGGSEVFLFFQFGLIFAAAFTLSAHAAGIHCQLGINLEVDGKTHRKCQIVGHSSSHSKGAKTFYASCEGQGDDGQIEYLEGSAVAKLVDATSRQEIAKCVVNKKQFSALIKEYQTHDLELENQKCYLTQWKGQMMFVANGVKGRCSFNISKNKLAEFKMKTGITPLYQCENDYFLSIGEKTAASIYRKSKDGWQLACKATMRTGEPVEPIDWKNPPKYYVPEASVLGLMTGSPQG